MRELGYKLGDVEHLVRQIPLGTGAHAARHGAATWWSPGKLVDVALSVSGQLLAQLIITAEHNRRLRNRTGE